MARQTTHDSSSKSKSVVYLFFWAFLLGYFIFGFCRISQSLTYLSDFSATNLFFSALSAKNFSYSRALANAYSYYSVLSYSWPSSEMAAALSNYPSLQLSSSLTVLSPGIPLPIEFTLEAIFFYLLVLIFWPFISSIKSPFCSDFLQLLPMINVFSLL